MKKFLPLIISLISLGVNSQAIYYVTNQAGEPYGSNANISNMNTAFGTNNWTKVYFQTVNPNAVFSPTTCFVYCDGSSQSANELDTFLVYNQSLIQSWVSSGGHLYINAAPNEGGDINLGMGAQLSYSTGPYCTTITAAPGNTNHPVFSGPFAPAGYTYTANYASHGYISCGTCTAVVTGSVGQVLAELNVGSGKAMFGCINTSNWISPVPNGPNFKSNILKYMGNGCGGVGLSSPSAIIDRLYIAPNPGKGQFEVTVNNELPKNIVVTDLTGETIFQSNTSASKIALDISERPAGIYFVKVSSNSQIRVAKIIKE